MFKIGNIKIKNQVVMAPMAGITNMAFRKIIKDFGAGLVYSEMVSDKALCYGNTKTIDMLQVDDGEHPVSIQLFGGEVETMVKAAKFIDQHSNCDIIDINMGCPVNKVLKADAGSKLLLYPDKIYEIVKGIVDNVSKPVTVKIRSGFDSKHINAVEVAKLIEKGKAYSIEEAVALVKETSKVKFDAAVDVAFRLGVDPRQADQQLRGALVLPNGTGKTKKVLVVTEGPKAQEAKDAGADVVGGKEILEDIKKGWLDFEVMIATPDMMAELGKLGRILGPKGLMPNPKTGTVTMDVAKAVKETKAGKVTYRTDKEGNVQLTIGRVSFENDKLVENFNAIYDLLVKIKPSTSKGVYMRNIAISSTMGPSIKVSAAK